MLEEEARRLIETFITYKTHRRPFGILKLAMTLDGKIATREGESRWITSDESRYRVHQLRHRVDAVITGSGTVIADKPQLTDRSGLPRRRPLLRVILDRRGRISDYGDALIFRGDLKALTSELYHREVQSFLLECGPDLAFGALRAGIIDKIVAFIAPQVLGGREIPAIGGEGAGKLSEAIRLHDWTAATSGPDLVLTAYVHRNH
jgi:diaminohydroxyphosphoribosylaminopyrimidine deaminase/5-amino-6-(5-phosphoribosylamino)uracil reductase